MARPLHLTRPEAEYLVELLEDYCPEKFGTWRHDMADDVRELFGMISREEEEKARNATPSENTSK